VIELIVKLNLLTFVPYISQFIYYHYVDGVAEWEERWHINPNIRVSTPGAVDSFLA